METAHEQTTVLRNVFGTGSGQEGTLPVGDRLQIMASGAGRDKGCLDQHNAVVGSPSTVFLGLITDMGDFWVCKLRVDILGYFDILEKQEGNCMVQPEKQMISFIVSSVLSQFSSK